MLNIYGSLMPLRLLEEIHFWKTKEKEYTAVIRELTPDLESSCRETLLQWETIFANMESFTQQLISSALCPPFHAPPCRTPHMELLVRASVIQSQRFIRQLLRMQKQSAAIGATAATKRVIRHTVRESHYFIGALHAATSGTLRPAFSSAAAAGAVFGPTP